MTKSWIALGVGFALLAGCSDPQHPSNARDRGDAVAPIEDARDTATDAAATAADAAADATKAAGDAATAAADAAAAPAADGYGADTSARGAPNPPPPVPPPVAK